MIEQQLNNLGFTDKEVTVYLALLRNGKSNPATLAKLTGINRTTVYSVAKELINRGVITEDLGSKKSELLALPPTELVVLAQREERQLAEKRRAIDAAIKELEIVAQQTKYSIPKITFVEEDGIEPYLRQRTPEWNRSLKEVNPTWWGFQDDTFVKHYGDWISWYWEQAADPAIDLKLLSTETDIEKAMQAKGYTNRKIRFWDGLNIDATTWINGDYVVMIVTNQRPHYLVEIHDATLARNQRAVFQRIWRSLDTEQGSVSATRTSPK